MKINNSYIKALLLFICYFLLTFMLTYFLIESEISQDSYVVRLCTTAILLVVTVSIYKFFLRSKELPVKEKVNVLFYISLIAILFFVSNDFIVNIYYIIGSYDFAEIQNVDFSVEVHLIQMLDSILLKPILEELFFRGILLAFFIKSGKKLFYPILFTSLLFSLNHINPSYVLDSLPTIAMTFIFSIIACYIYIKTKNIIFPIVFHVLNNLLAFLLTLNRKEYGDLIMYLNFDYRYWLIILFSCFLLVIAVKSFIKYPSKSDRLEV